MQLLANPFVTSFSPFGLRPARSHCRIRLAKNALFAMPNRGIVLATEETTNRTVCLVSTMHYNPASIARVVETVDTLACDNQLGPVVVELCPSRYTNWKKQSNILRRVLLTSEMQIAAERAKLAGVDFILGDQPIELLGERTAEIFHQTVKDLVTPVGGWSRCAYDIARALRSVLSLPPGTTPRSFMSSLQSRLDLRMLDVAVLAGAPVSILRYSLAWVVGSPLSVVTVGLASDCRIRK